MSEAILPCAVCGEKAVPVTVDPPFIDYISCRNKCVMQAVTDTTTAERWNQLQRWIADGRAVEQCENLENGVRAGYYAGGNAWHVDEWDGVKVSTSKYAPTLAEAVRKAQGDE